MKYKVLIIGGVSLAIIIAIFAFLFGRQGGSNVVSGNLLVWGFEDATVWGELINVYESQNKGVDINYVQKTEENYETELLNALAAGTGPDIFPIHHTWLNKHLDKLTSFPPTFVGAQDFASTFVDVATKDLVRGGGVYAIPFYIDTLALYYNKDIFNSTGIVFPPKTWEEFNEVVTKTTNLSDARTILRSGVAIGTANNVNYASDILSAIMLQTGAQMLNPKTGRAAFAEGVDLNGVSYMPGSSSLSFYTDFAEPTLPVYTWNRRLANSLDAFERSETAMYIGYAKDLPSIKESGVSYGVTPLPQARDKTKDPNYLDLNYANYWAQSVNKLGRSRSLALSFLSFASSRNVLFNFLSKSGLPSPRRDLIQAQSRDQDLAIFALQSLTAESWAQPDFIEVKKIFNTMIEDIILGRLNSQESTEKGASQIDNLIKQ